MHQSCTIEDLTLYHLYTMKVLKLFILMKPQQKPQQHLNPTPYLSKETKFNADWIESSFDVGTTF